MWNYVSGSSCSRYNQSSPGRERGHARRHSSADAHQEEGEELTDQTATLTLTSATSRARAQSDSQHDRRRDGLYPSFFCFVSLSTVDPVPFNSKEPCVMCVCACVCVFTWSYLLLYLHLVVHREISFSPDSISVAIFPYKSNHSCCNFDSTSHSCNVF